MNQWSSRQTYNYDSVLRSILRSRATAKDESRATAKDERDNVEFSGCFDLFATAALEGQN